MWCSLLLLLSTCLLAAPHGGRFQAPIVPDGEAEAPTPDSLPDSTTTLPGYGPPLEVETARWEWWFEYHHEDLLDLKRLMPMRADDRPFAPVADRDRTKTLLPLFVDSLRRDSTAVGRVRPERNPRDVRAAAVMALGRLNSAEAVPYIELVIDQDPDLFVRTEAILALGVSGQPSAVETLVRIFRDEDESTELRCYAAAALGLIDDSHAIEVLGKALEPDALASLGLNQLRISIVHAAGVTGSPRLGDIVREVLGATVGRNEYAVRALAARALGSIDDLENIEPLLELLGDPDNQVRRSASMAAIGLAPRMLPEDVERLVARFRDVTDLPSRLNLARALGPTESDAAREVLIDSLKATNLLVRANAALGLALDEDGDHVDRVLAAFRSSPEPTLKGSYALALGLMEADAAADALSAALVETADPQVVPYLMLGLGLIGPDLDGLVARVERIVDQSHDVEVQRWGVVTLGLLGARGTLDELSANVAEVPSLIDRATQVHALGIVGDREQLDDLVAVAEDETQAAFVRAYALLALGELGDPRPLTPVARLARHAELSLDVGFLLEMYRSL